jgi:WD40 repeat protein/tRNA A-37 threonylcarbamoyl transferase component Bud32
MDSNLPGSAGACPRARFALNIEAEAGDDVTVERWTQVQSLYLAAEALPGAQRDAFLRGACAGDDALRAEVQALLDASGDTRGTAAPRERDDAVAEPLAAGTRLGPWSIERLVGRGGMGEVYQARRADGAFELRVAIKLLKRGMDTDAVLARFGRERRILAQLAHPNVARVLDAGAAPDGRPFLAMEFVDGRAITDYADAAQLDVPAMLRLMITVCEAVQAAHDQRIVHRDLKPSNVLVTGDGQVKLLDFGIAKALAEDDADSTRLAGERSALTPAYAAPEQLRGDAPSAATDVYGLGVILYQLLTGRLPQRERETAERPTAVLRKDRGRLPEKLRLQRLKEISADLDLIVGKTLHADPARRYGAAQEFADDLRRLLDDRPILARPDSSAYRAGRFARRNRRVLSQLAAVAAIAALIAGGLLAVQERRHVAQALQTRIGALFESGRRELLARNQARAAVFLGEAYRLGLDTPALRFALGRAMRVVDAARLSFDTGSPVLELAMSPDGARIATVGIDWHLRIWDALTGARRVDVDLGELGVWVGPQFSPDGSKLRISYQDASGSGAHLRIWDVGTGTQLAKFDIARDSVGDVQAFDHGGQHASFVAPDHTVAVATFDGAALRRVPGEFTLAGFVEGGELLLTANAQGAVEAWNAETLQRVRSFAGGLTPPLSSLETGGALLAAGDGEGAVRVWNLASGALQMAGGLAGGIRQLMFDAGGDRLLALARDGAAVWNTGPGTLAYALKFVDHGSGQTLISPNGSAFATSSNARLAMIDVVTGRELYSLDGHLGGARSMAFSADGASLATGGPDGKVIVWTLPPEPSATLGDAGAPRGAHPGVVAFSHDGALLFGGGADGSGRLWHYPSLAAGAVLSGHQAALGAVAFSADDRMLATGGDDKAICLWDTASGRLPKRLDQLRGRVLLLRFSPDGRTLSAAVRGGVTELWSTASFERLASFDRDEARAQSFSPDGQRIAIGAQGAVKLWDIAGKRFVWSTPLPGGGASPKAGPIAFAATGERLFVSLESRDGFILDAADGHVVQHVSDPSSVWIDSAEFDAAGQRAVLGNFSNMAQAWNLADNSVQTFSGHAGAVRTATFMADGALLLTAADDGTAKIWDVRSAELLDTVAIHAGAYVEDSVAFGAGATRVLTGASDGRVRLWDTSSESRSPAQVLDRLACGVPWQLAGDELVPAAADAQRCAPASPRP